MSDKIYTFQDILREEFDIEKTISDDELDEDEELLDIVITDYDMEKAETIETELDEFFNDFDMETEEIVKRQEEEDMEDLYEFFDEDAAIFEGSVDADLEDIEEVEDPEFEDELGFIDNMEDFPEVDDEEAFSIDMEV